jgi:hypothetical protein
MKFLGRVIMTFRSFAALLLLTSALFSQDFRATLTGQVTDPSGSAIPGAVVKTLNTATNEAREARTTAEGLYTVPYLEPGIYNIEISAAGFESLKRDAITLEVAQRLDLPVKLRIGAANTEVTVSGQQELIDAGDANRGLVFDPIKVQEYPLNGRQTYMLMDLTPGVMFMQTTFGPTGFSGTRAWDVTNAYKINGAREGFNNLFLLNGAPISDNQGTWQFAPTVDAVQEFKVMTSTYDAAYGRVAGGVVNSTIKSGGKKWAMSTTTGATSCSTPIFSRTISPSIPLPDSAPPRAITTGTSSAASSAARSAKTRTSSSPATKASRKWCRSPRKPPPSPWRFAMARISRFTA